MISQSPLDQRRSGILLHPTSLAGPYGSGDLGPGAYRFIDFLSGAGQTLWQMLPIGPIGAGNSPYDSPSSFAGNPLLISLEELGHAGWLSSEDLRAPPVEDDTVVDYDVVPRFRQSRLELAAQRFFAQANADQRGAFDAFVARQGWWLEPYAVYAALKEHHGGQPWFTWGEALTRCDEAALAQATQALKCLVERCQFEQFVFDQQWTRLRQYASERGVKLLGDVPMFVAYDGADVWRNQRLFFLDENGERTVVAGVPPDYFSEHGQRWGNPLYRWDVMAETNFHWLIERLSHGLARFDALRLDHFIAFHRYWEIPAHADTAKQGRYVEVPGVRFFEELRQALGRLPFLAEDLGLVTPEVRQLRERFGLPGMSVLQFGFAEGAELYQPHRATPRLAIYTGTHDNNTLMGWFNEQGSPDNVQQRDAMKRERQRALAYAGSDGTHPEWDIMRIALMSVANTTIFPLQDVLGLDGSARMNIPGTPSGNWRWRMRETDLDRGAADRLCEMCELYERIPRGER